MNLYKVKPAMCQAHEDPGTSWQMPAFHVVADSFGSAWTVGMMHGIKSMNEVNEKIDKKNAEEKAKQEVDSDPPQHIMAIMGFGRPGFTPGEVPHISEFAIEKLTCIMEDIPVEHG